LQPAVIYETTPSEYVLKGAKKNGNRGYYNGTEGRVRDNKFRVQASAGKVMVSVFWHFKDDVLRTMTSCSAACFKRFDASGEEIFTRPGKIVSCKGGQVVLLI
jgi:hypothetical protein